MSFQVFFHDILNLFWAGEVREAVKNYLADFCAKGLPAPPSPPPLAENHFAKKSLAEMGGTPPLTEKIR